jgi:hypothetical protein
LRNGLGPGPSLPLYGRTGMRAHDLALQGRACGGGRLSRRRLAAVLVALAGPLIVSPGRAESVAAPVALQADLLAKVAAYDRNFVERAGERAQILLVTQPNNADSVNVAQQMSAALGRFAEIGGLPHDEAILAYPGPSELARICRDRRIAIVYFGPGFHDDVRAIRGALASVPVLSVAAVPDYVREGIVLGFDVISGHPKLLFNLTQAKLQKVALTASVLKLMTVFE